MPTTDPVATPKDPGARTDRAPPSGHALAGAVSQPAWRDKTSWYLVATEDRMIPPPAQRVMANRAEATVGEVAVSQSLYVSQARGTAAVIKQDSPGPCS